jgi:hypothetical protein
MNTDRAFGVTQRMEVVGLYSPYFSPAICCSTGYGSACGVMLGPSTPSVATTRQVGRLDVLQRIRLRRPWSQALHSQNYLRHFATKAGEKCGLAARMSSQFRCPLTQRSEVRVQDETGSWFVVSGSRLETSPSIKRQSFGGRGSWLDVRLLILWLIGSIA